MMTGIIAGEVEKEDCSKDQEQHRRMTRMGVIFQK